MDEIKINLSHSEIEIVYNFLDDLMRQGILTILKEKNMLRGHEEFTGAEVILGAIDSLLNRGNRFFISN